MEPVALILLLIGLAWAGLFAFIHFRAVGKAKASETWPTSPGRIVSSQVIVEEDSDRDGGTTTWYNPAVRYSYSVAGQALEGSRIRFANMRKSSRAKAEAILAPYAEGSTVMVRYNPEKPKESVLETQKPGPLYLVMAAFGLLFIIFGLFWNSLV